MKEVKVLNNQNIIDIVLQEYGDLEFLFEVVELNNLSVTEALSISQKINVNTDANNQVIKFFRKEKIKPASRIKAANNITADGIGVMIIGTNFRIG